MATTADLTSGQVMDKAASLLNDTAKSIFPYTVQLPYLNMALQELQETFELNEVPVTDTVSSVILISAGTDHVGFSMTNPALPNDLIEPQVLWERTHGIDPYTPMTKLDFLPRYMEGQETNQLIWYVWQSQEIRFLPANLDIDIKMDYIRNLFFPFTQVDGSDQVGVINAASFLEFRTAGLLARFVAENPTRADNLDGQSVFAIDRALGIGSKGRQAITTRRRPFRAAYKQRVYS